MGKGRSATVLSMCRGIAPISNEMWTVQLSTEPTTYTMNRAPGLSASGDHYHSDRPTDRSLASLPSAGLADRTFNIVYAQYTDDVESSSLVSVNRF